MALKKPPTPAVEKLETPDAAADEQSGDGATATAATEVDGAEDLLQQTDDAKVS